MASGNLTPLRRGALSGSGRSGSPRGGSVFDLHRQMNQLFDDLFDPATTGSPRQQGLPQGWSSPALEVHQSDDAVEITAELPGVKEDDIDLTIEDGVLTLRGEKRSSKTDEAHGYSERSYGRFERSISLPTNIDEEKCAADFRDGVLTITLPRAADRQRGRRIPLGSGSGEQHKLQAQNDSDSRVQQQAAQENQTKSASDTQQG